MKVVLVEMTRQCYDTVDNRFIEVLQNNVRKAVKDAGDGPIVLATMPGIIENIKIFEN